MRNKGRTTNWGRSEFFIRSFPNSLFSFLPVEYHVNQGNHFLAGF